MLFDQHPVRGRRTEKILNLAEMASDGFFDEGRTTKGRANKLVTDLTEALPVPPRPVIRAEGVGMRSLVAVIRM